MPADTAMIQPTATRTLAGLLGIHGDPAASLEVSGIAYDSRRVRPGDLFFALPGALVDGARFAPQAAAKGALAVVAERTLSIPVPAIVVPNARRSMAEAALRFYNHPDNEMDLVGIVGTNGKSTIAAGLETVWSSSGIPAGLIGTITYRWGNRSIPAPRTTPESPDLVSLLDCMRSDGVRNVACEVSSHAIALDRVWGIRFRAGIFTNVTRDHLDFHKTFEEYRRVKALFFENLSGPKSFAVINVDDPSAEVFVRAAKNTRVIRYSVRRRDVDVGMEVTSHSFDGTRGQLLLGGEVHSFFSPLWGRFNHANLAAIAGAAWGAGLPGAQVAEGLAAFGGISGRLESIPSSAPFDVFVDYAHTPDALDAVLSAARPLVRGKLRVLFGAGGDRDRGKRPEMARAVEKWADQIYLTSDNPRSEDPLAIIEDVRSGFSTGTPIICDPDRYRAIERAVADANPGDVVFLCGKGHEQTQEIAGVFHRFSDQETAAGILAAGGHPPQNPQGKRGGIPPGSAVGPGGDPPPSRS